MCVPKITENNEYMRYNLRFELSTVNVKYLYIYIIPIIQYIILIFYTQCNIMIIMSTFVVLVKLNKYA